MKNLMMKRYTISEKNIRKINGIKYSIAVFLILSRVCHDCWKHACVTGARVLIRKRGTQLGETLPNSLFEIVLENTF